MPFDDDSIQYIINDIESEYKLFEFLPKIRYKMSQLLKIQNNAIRCFDSKKSPTVPFVSYLV